MIVNLSGVVKENVKDGLDLNKMSASSREKAIKNIYSKKCSEMLEWVDLPDMSQSEIDEYVSYGNQIYKKYKNFVVLGIGGSALGVSMLKNTFIDSLYKDIGVNVFVCDNIDSDSFVSLMDKLDLKKTMFNVITKSGGTSETLAQLLIVLNRFERKKIDFRKNICVTTTKGNDLDKWALNEGLKTFYIPKGVGGRFSVLSAVGLLPASVMGIDISLLLKGARQMREKCKLSNFSNPAYTCAYINYEYLKKGLTSLVVMPYSDRLALVTDFFAQLWGESLGKRFDRKGQEVNTGQTPIKTKGVTDQHSQLQLYSEGLKDKLFMFIQVEKNSYDEMIEKEISVGKHLVGTTLKGLLDIECDSTMYSLTTLDRPNYSIGLNCINEETVGELIFFLEMMTAFMGEFMNIDAYDQPGVELSKCYTKACLGLKGYEKQAKEIKEYKKNSRKFWLK